MNPAAADYSIQINYLELLFRRDVLRATCMEQNGAQGWLNFKFDATARSFNGEWGNLGRPLGGLWNGTRNP